VTELCEHCDREGIQFFSDEIYHGISYGKKEATALSYSKNAIVINSFSKYYRCVNNTIMIMATADTHKPRWRAHDCGIFVRWQYDWLASRVACSA